MFHSEDVKITEITVDEQSDDAGEESDSEEGEIAEDEDMEEGEVEDEDRHGDESSSLTPPERKKRRF